MSANSHLDGLTVENILELSSDWFWRLDADLRFTHLSDQMSGVIGTISEDILGRTFEELWTGRAITRGVVSPRPSIGHHGSASSLSGRGRTPKDAFPSETARSTPMVDS